MMLNDMMTITNSGDMLSGTGRSQAMKDGSFIGQSSLTDDPECQQKNFLSIMSQFSMGMVQTTPEEVKTPELKLAEGQLPDEVKADNVSPEKTKEKQGKDSGIVKRGTAVLPETLGFIMGLLTLPDPLQPELSMEPAFRASGSENQETIDSDSIVGELLPETNAQSGLPDNRNSQAGKVSMMPVQSDSDQNSSAQVETMPKIQVKDSPDVGLLLTGWRQPVVGTVPEAPGVSKAEVSSTAPRVQGVPVERMAENLGEPVQPTLVSAPVSDEPVQSHGVDVKVPPVFTGWRQNVSRTVPESPGVSRAEVSGTASRVQDAPVEVLGKNPIEQVESSLVLEPVSTEPVQPQRVDVKAPPVFAGVRHFSVVTALESESESALKSDASSTVQVQDVPVKGTPKMHRQQRDLQSIPNMMNDSQSAEKNAIDMNLDFAKKIPADSMVMDATASEQFPADQQNDLDRPQSVKARSASFHSEKDSAETGGIVVTSAETSNADDNDTSSMFMAGNNSDKFFGAEKDSTAQPSEPKFADLAINYAKEGQVEKTPWVNSTPAESRVEGRTFETEVLQQIVEKTATDFKSGRSEIRIDLKPESLGHLRLHVSTEHQQVSVKILAENSLVKEMIENQVSMIKNELQNQGINVISVKVDMLMSGGSDFASSQNEGSAFKQARHEPAYGSGKGLNGKSALQEPEPLDQAGTRGGSLVNYFA